MLPPMPLCRSSPSTSFWLAPNSILLLSRPCEILLERHPWISRMGTCSRGEPHTCDDHVAPEWSVKFSIASSCTWSLSVSSNSCLKTLSILNFLQSVWKLLQENSELENFPEIFSHCFDPPRRKQPMDSLVTLDSPDLFHASLQCGDFYLRIMNSKRHYFHSFGKDKPLSSPNPWPHPQHLFLSGTQTMGFPE